jgi:hypothetical protein
MLESFPMIAETKARSNAPDTRRAITSSAWTAPLTKGFPGRMTFISFTALDLHGESGACAFIASTAEWMIGLQSSSLEQPVIRETPGA